MSCIPAGLQPPARSIRKGFLFAAGSLTALSTIVFARVVRTAHRLRRWQEDLAQVLPFPG